MNVGELRELIEDLDDEVVLRIGTQPSWPLAFTVRSIVTPGAIEEYREYDGNPDGGDERDGFVWIVTGDHPYDESPYAPRILWDI
jgi:hypothetical protein